MRITDREFIKNLKGRCENEIKNLNWLTNERRVGMICAYTNVIVFIEDHLQTEVINETMADFKSWLKEHQKGCEEAADLYGEQGMFDDQNALEKKSEAFEEVLEYLNTHIISKEDGNDD